MPIIVRDYTWSQSNNTVHIRIPLNPVNHEKVDLFPTDRYIKAHFSPFLFEVFLLHDVNIKKSKCIVNDDLIVLDLMKNEEIAWDCLEKDLTKEEKMKIKQEVLEKCQEQAKQESEDRRIKKTQLDRFTVQQAMEIDNKQHDLMDSRRNFERTKAMESLEKWRVGRINSEEEKEMTSPYPKRSGVEIVELPASDDEGHGDDNIRKPTSPKLTVTTVEKYSRAPLPDDKVHKDDNKTKLIPPRHLGTTGDKSLRKPVKTPIKSEYVEKKKQETAKRVLPRLREAINLEVTHTPRTFPTPSRESTASEEQAWLKNITLARRATGFVSEDLRPEEQDPQWCKEKGDEFFRIGNFLGAVSAYTHGITLSDKLPSLFANRSATHFALGNFNKCLNDCSTALDLMKPACESNRRSRAKCIARRAAALARLGYLSKAIDEMKAAAKLMPEDESIKKDVYDMERAWEQNPDSD